MRKLVYSAVALTLVSAPGFANENEWSSLDQEINNLSTSLSAQNAAGPKLGGYIRTSFRYSDDNDALFAPGNTEDEQGFKLDKVRIEIKGDLSQDYSYAVSFDLSSGTADLKDAFIAWKLAESVKGTMGRFRAPFIRSALGSNKNLLFSERTALGDFFDARDEGLMFSGNFDTIEWWIAGQNGTDQQVGGGPSTSDKVGSDFAYTARLVANLMGSGVSKVEGAYGAGEETNLSVGIAWRDDQSLDDGTTIGIEANMTAGPFSLSGEVVDFDKGTPVGGSDVWGSDLHYGSDNSIVSSDPADTTPWDITGSYLFTDQYEGMLRYEDSDNDTSDITAWTLGVNRYIQGHDIKWTLQVMKTDGDTSAQELTEYTLGLTVGI